MYESSVCLVEAHTCAFGWVPLLLGIFVCVLKHGVKCVWYVQDYKTNTGHGKLLLDNSLYPEAYATNVNEQVCCMPWIALRCTAMLITSTAARHRCKRCLFRQLMQILHAL